MHDGASPDEYASDAAIGERRPVLAADLDFHALDRLAAIDDRAVAARAAVGTAVAAAEDSFLHQLEPDAFARRHQRHGQRGFGKAVAWAES